MANIKATGKAASVPAGLISGVLCAAAATLTGTAVTAHLISKEILKWDGIGYCILVFILISSWAGSCMTIHKIKRRRLMMGIASGVIYFTFLLAITALFFGGNYSGVGETGLLILCGSMLGVLSTGNSMRTKNKRRKSFGYR